MELNINSPAYFKEHYGIDDEVYKFCQKAYVFFKDKEYLSLIHISEPTRPYAISRMPSSA